MNWFRQEQAILFLIEGHGIQRINHIELPAKRDDGMSETVVINFLDENLIEREALVSPDVANVLANMWGKNDRLP